MYTQQSRPISSIIQGVGIGLRTVHINDILQTSPNIPWFEILADNFLGYGGISKEYLHTIRENYPITLHCVGMNLGSIEPLDFDYLKNIKQMLHDYEVSWVSDHLCWTAIKGEYSHDLLPTPYTEESLEHIKNRINIVQDFIETNLLIENVSSYLTFKHSHIDEWQFINEICEQTNCSILLDVNNLYVSQYNHGLDINSFIENINLSHIQEIHLAGYEVNEGYLLDAHNNHVSDEVWNLYRNIIKKVPKTPTLIEWDNDIPELNVLIKEASIAQEIAS